MTNTPEPARSEARRPPRPRRIIRAAIAVAVATIGLTLGPSTSALAAEDLTSSYPAVDSVTATAPDEMTLTFDQELRPGSDVVLIEVISPSGENVVVDEVSFNGASATQHLAANAGPGQYRVRWQLTSDGGELTEGEYAFTIDPALNTTAPSPDPTSDAAPSPHPDEAPSDYEAGTAPQADGIFLPFIGVMFPIAIIAPVAGMVLMMRRDRKRRDMRDSDEA